MPASNHKVITIGTFRFYPQRNTLASPERTIHLTPKTASVLWQLVRHAGETVHRERLINAVWQTGLASDELLTRAITDLRKAFSDSFRNPRYIETIPKVGYRLLADVQAEQEQQREAVEQPPNTTEKPPAQTSSALPPSLLFPALLVLALAVLLTIAGLRKQQQNADNADASTTQVLTYNFRSMTAYQEHSSAPALSPGGDFMVFSARSQGDHATALNSLYIQHRDGTWPVRISPDDGASYPSAAVSPSGHSLAFARLSDSDCGIYTMPVFGSVLFDRISDCSQDYPELDWSPDGRYVAVVAPRGESSTAIQLISMLPNVPDLELHVAGNSEAEYMPRFSHDGRYIAAIQQGTGLPASINVYEISSLQATRQIELQDCCLAMDWGPDSDHLFLVRENSDAARLELLNLTSGQSSIIMGTQDVTGVDTAIQTLGVALSRRNSEQSIWRLAISEESFEPESLIDSARSDHSPSVSPDGSWLAFVSDRSGDEQLWRYNLQTSEQQQLTNLRNVIIRNPRWSPSGSHLLFTASADQSPDLYYVDISNAMVQPLALPNIHASAEGHWRLDGDSIAFFCRLGEDWNLCETSLQSPGSINILEEGFSFPLSCAYVADTAGGSEMLYYVAPNSGHLQAFDYITGESHMLMPYDPQSPISLLQSFNDDLILGFSNASSAQQLDLLLAANASVAGNFDPSTLRPVGRVERSNEAFVSDGAYLYITRRKDLGEYIEMMLPGDINQPQ